MKKMEKSSRDSALFSKENERNNGRQLLDLENNVKNNIKIRKKMTLYQL